MNARSEPTLTSERELVDNRKIREEYGLPKETAYEIMRAVGVIDLQRSGVKKLYVRRAELDAWLDANQEKPYGEKAEAEGP